MEIIERRRSVGSQHGRESLEREFGRESAERQHSPKSLEMREYESADRDLREWDSGGLAAVVVGQAAPAVPTVLIQRWGHEIERTLVHAATFAA